MPNERTIIAGVIAITILAIGIIVALGGKSAPPPITPAAVEKPELIRDTSWRKGNPNAKVTLVEFGDFQCPGCGATYPILKKLSNDYGEKLSIVFREYPLSDLHANADAAARAAEAAGQQGKFFEMHDKLYEHQNEWASSRKPTSYFDRYARETGLNTSQFSDAMSNETTKNRISQDLGDGDALGIEGTPTIFINGNLFTGTPSYASLKSTIDRLLQ